MEKDMLIGKRFLALVLGIFLFLSSTLSVRAEGEVRAGEDSFLEEVEEGVWTEIAQESFPAAADAPEVPELPVQEENLPDTYGELPQDMPLPLEEEAAPETPEAVWVSVTEEEETPASEDDIQVSPQGTEDASLAFTVPVQDAGSGETAAEDAALPPLEEAAAETVPAAAADSQEPAAEETALAPVPTVPEETAVPDVTETAEPVEQVFQEVIYHQTAIEEEPAEEEVVVIRPSFASAYQPVKVTSCGAEVRTEVISTVTVTPEVQGGNGTYAFNYWVFDANGIIVWSHTNTLDTSWTFQTDRSGVYLVRVYVTDFVTEHYLDSTWFTAYGRDVRVNGVWVDQDGHGGSMARGYASVTGGAGQYAYNYWLFDANGTIVMDHTNTMDVAWDFALPEKTGVYLLRIYATDFSTEHFADSAWFYVRGNEVMIDAIELSGEKKKNTWLQAVPRVSGGNGYYAFNYYLLNGKGKVLDKKEGTMESSWTFLCPSQTGEYGVSVYATDFKTDYWSSVSFHAEGDSPLTVIGRVMEPQNGGKMSFEPVVTGGAGSVARSYWLLDASGNVVDSLLNTMEDTYVTPELTGGAVYAFRVYLTDFVTEVLYETPRFRFRYGSDPEFMPLTIDSVQLSASSWVSGATATATVKAWGGVGTMFFNYWLLDVAGRVLDCKLATADTSWTFTLPVNGSYTVRVYATDFVSGEDTVDAGETTGEECAWFHVWPSGSDPTFATAEEKARWVVNNYITPDMDDYTRALVLHDWLIANVEYNLDAYNGYSNPNNAYAYDAAGALLYGQAVCDGYSKAYSMLLDLAGVRNERIIGTGNGGGHAWNKVCLDGTWVHVDVTWDDPVWSMTGTTTGKPLGSERHEYFGLTDLQMSQDHGFSSSNCTSEAYNYYKKNANMCSTEQEYQQMFLSQVAAGAKRIITSWYKQAVPGESYHEIVWFGSTALTEDVLNRTGKTLVVNTSHENGIRQGSISIRDIQPLGSAEALAQRLRQAFSWNETILFVAKSDLSYATEAFNILIREGTAEHFRVGTVDTLGVLPWGTDLVTNAAIITWDHREKETETALTKDNLYSRVYNELFELAWDDDLTMFNTEGETQVASVDVPAGTELTDAAVADNAEMDIDLYVGTRKLEVKARPFLVRTEDSVMSEGKMDMSMRTKLYLAYNVTVAY